MLHGLRILIADQHVNVRTWMRERLSVIGATSISMAANASEMMRMARNIEFDIVICDHHLDAKRDGQQLLEELRFQHILPLRSVFIIATAERKHKHVVAAAEFAPDDYLVKPYTPEQLSVRLTRTLRKKKALRHVFDHLELCNHEQTIAACDQAAKATPRYALDAFRIKAESLVALGRVEEASQLYESITATRAVPWARMGFAMMLQRQKKFAQAKDEAYTLNQEHPEFMSVYDFLAGLHEEAGEYAEAIECLERASAIASADNIDRLRKIVQLAEAAGDQNRLISTLKRVVERTRRSSMLKLDDYLSLTRSLLDEERVDEAAKVVDDMRGDTKSLPSGALVSEVATAMLHHSKGKTSEARDCMRRIAELADKESAPLSDTLAIEIAEQAAHHGEVKRATALFAKLSLKQVLPGKFRQRLDSWFGAEEETPQQKPAGRPSTDKASLSEKIIGSMNEAMQALEEDWCESIANDTREMLIEAFTLMPRDKRVIHAHIRYNSIAVQHGSERHTPTVRASD
jgi:DNA-binding response OmpR family regulator